MIIESGRNFSFSSRVLFVNNNFFPMMFCCEWGWRKREEDRECEKHNINNQSESLPLVECAAYDKTKLTSQQHHRQLNPTITSNLLFFSIFTGLPRKAGQVTPSINSPLLAWFFFFLQKLSANLNERSRTTILNNFN